MRTRDDIRELLAQVLDAVSAPDAEIAYFHKRSLDTRFGDNAITQNLGGEEEGLRLQVAYGQRHGSSITNRLDEESLDRLVQTAEGIAGISPEDPEHMPLVPAQDYPHLPPRYDFDTADLSPQGAADRVAQAVGRAKVTGYTTSGLHSVGSRTSALANTAGLEAFDQSSTVSFSVTMHGPRGSGSAAGSGESLAQVDAEALAQTALDTAQAAQDPQDIEPGDYDVVFEPRATADLLGFLIWSLRARDADEGTTPFAGKVGEALFSDQINLQTRLDDPQLPASPIGADGLAARPMTWIDKGVLKRLYHTRYWAQEKKVEPDPTLYPLHMSGGEASVDALIGQCQRGLLVKRLWYIRHVDPRQLLLTGMTRDGLFLIEDGKVTRPVINLRFNESPLVFLKNAQALSRAERVGTMKVPGVLSQAFTFSSKTESV